MKRVIFICLLSLSVCLSKPSDQQPLPAAAQTPNVPPVDAKAPPPKAAEQTPITVPGHNDTQTTELAKAGVQPATATPAAAPAIPAANEAKPKDEAKPDEKDNKTNNEKKDAQPPQAKDDKVNPPKDDKNAIASGTADNKNIENNKTKTDGKGDDKEVTTQKTEVTTKAAVTPGDIHVQARGFDGPSFIGGIILTLGLLAIGFMGFKYYKNQTERNYHTL